jgi:hypothetical protein
LSNFALLNNVDHKDVRIITERSARYGDNVNFVMTFPFEFRSVQAFYPILFHRDAQGEFYPVALFGFESGENLFLDETGWHARYVPAMIRRQPFLIGFEADTRQGGERRRMLSLDLDSPRVGKERGEPLFEPLGGRTPFLEEMATLLETLYHGAEHNRKFVAALQGHALIESVTFDIALARRQPQPAARLLRDRRGKGARTVGRGARGAEQERLPDAAVHDAGLDDEHAHARGPEERQSATSFMTAHRYPPRSRSSRVAVPARSPRASSNRRCRCCSRAWSRAGRRWRPAGSRWRRRPATCRASGSSNR